MHNVSVHVSLLVQTDLACDGVLSSKLQCLLSSQEMFASMLPTMLIVMV